MDSLSVSVQRSRVFPSLQFKSNNLRRCEQWYALSLLCYMVALVLIIRGGGLVFGSPWMASLSAIIAFLSAASWYMLYTKSERAVRVFSELTYFGLGGAVYFLAQINLNGNQAEDFWWVSSLGVPFLIAGSLISVKLRRIKRADLAVQ